MKSYESSAVIEASPEKIWAILTDGPGLSAWQSGVVRSEGRIAPGETRSIRSGPSLSE